VYLEQGEDLVVVASNWGRASHPAWSANLLAAPGATVQIGRRCEHVLARRATPEEQAQLWPRLIALCPVWQTYADRSGRDLRVFILSRKDHRSQAGAS
jgi:deazaflavin-dependent oxidoreductase (nitroreductase family)